MFPPKAEINTHAGQCKEFGEKEQKDQLYLFATHSVINTHKSQNVFDILQYPNKTIIEAISTAMHIQAINILLITIPHFVRR